MLIRKACPAWAQCSLRVSKLVHPHAIPRGRNRARVAPTTVAVAYSQLGTTVVEQRTDSAAGVTKLLYDGIVLDMDGTLTKSNIDFEDMRNRTGIPVGDLFTVMEAWQNPERIEAAMKVILELEAVACQELQPMTGLLDLFKLLSSRQEWGVEPSRLLMVGDSLEDVECGNAAGTATCLIAGGGNERPGAAPSAPPAGAEPTFAVQNLKQLAAALKDGSSGDAGSTAMLMLGWPARREIGECVVGAGAPPPGLEFLDFLHSMGAVRACSCSFPRMGAAAGGLATSPIRGDRVLHLGCGSGALTKMMASQGMQVVGVDIDVQIASRRGLQALPFVGEPLSSASLALVAAHGPFHAVIFYGGDAGSTLGHIWHTSDALKEVCPLLAPGGSFCVEAPWPQEHGAAAALEATLAELGLRVIAMQRLAGNCDPDRVCLVARKQLQH